MALPAGASPVVVLQRIEGESAMEHSLDCGGAQEMAPVHFPSQSASYAMLFPHDFCWATYGFTAYQDSLMSLDVHVLPAHGSCMVWEAYIGDWYAVGSQELCGGDPAAWKSLTVFRDVPVGAGGHIVKVVSRITVGPASSDAYLDYVQASIQAQAQPSGSPGSPTTASPPTATHGTSTTGITGTTVPPTSSASGPSPTNSTSPGTTNATAPLSNSSKPAQPSEGPGAGPKAPPSLLGRLIAAVSALGGLFLVARQRKP